MADIAKIKRNIGKMIDANAPESDIDAYIASEGVTLDEIRNFKPPMSLEEGAAKARADIADVGKGVASGLAGGTVASITAPKDIGTLLGQTVGYGVGRLMGETPEQAKAHVARATQAGIDLDNSMLLPDPLTLLQKGYDAISGYLPTPTTPAGQTAQNIASFVPGAIVTPGMAVSGVTRKFAPAIATAIGAGAGSEAAGKLTEGTVAEPYARIGGMLAGGRIAGGRMSPTSIAASKAPTMEAVTAEKNALYKALDDMNVQYDPKDFMGAINKIDAAFKPGLGVSSPRSSAFLKDLKKLKPSEITWSNIDAWRKNANKLPFDESAARQEIINAIDDFIANAGIVTAKGGKYMPTTGQVAGMTKRARDLASRTIKADELEKRIAAGEAGYVSGPESGIGRQFASKAKSLALKGGRGYSELEQEAIAAAAQGSLPQNLLSKVGRLGPSADRGGGMLIPTAIGGATLVNPTLENLALAGGAMLAGTAARKGAAVMQKKAAEKAIKTILAGRGAQNAAISQADAINQAINRGYFSSGLLIPGLLNDEERR